MIEPSRRQRPTPEPAPPAPLTLHRRLASRRLWHLRLTVCSLLALSASLVAWLTTLPFAGHLLAVAAAFAAGFALPLRGLPGWALGWIASHSGFSYQTALEHEGASDPYGLGEAVQARARRQIEGLDPPRPPAWWLPLFAVALGLAFLPFANLGFGLPGPGAAPGPGALPSSSGSAEEPSPDTLEEEAQSLFEPDEALRADQPEGAESGRQGEGSAPNDGAGDALSDEASLDRFLDNLRQREALDPPQQDAQAPNVGQPRPGEGPPMEGEQSEQRSGSQAGEEEQSGEGEGQGEGAGQNQGEPQAGEQPEEGGGEGEEQGQGDEGLAEQPSGAGESPFAPVGEPQSEAGEGAQPNDGPPGEDASPERGESEGAGDLASEEQPSDGPLEGDLAPEEFLEGVLTRGPENPGGTLRLPGSDEVEAPTSTAPPDFRRAVEEAITEGRIPVEYQDVIKRYFR